LNITKNHQGDKKKNEPKNTDVLYIADLT